MSRSTTPIGDSCDPTRAHPALAAAAICGVMAIIAAIFGPGSPLAAQTALAVEPETPTPTSTPTTSPTLTPTPTPTATSTLTITPTPAWLARITYPALSLYPPVTRFIDLIGEYRADVTDDIWVWVQDPGGKYYPASMRPCEGQSTPKVNGKWEIFVGVGVEDSSGIYTLVLTVATAPASVSIGDALKEGCRTGIFPGFDVLPPGVTEVQRAQVTRRPVTGWGDTYPRSPTLPDARLPGWVWVAPFGSSGTVGQEEFINGTVTGATDRIWTLVYTFFGRWYPQSFDPCGGIHTTQNGTEWRAKVIFGNDQDVGKPFSAVVVLADAQADAYFDAMQREFCAGNHYPGFLTIELPPGLSQKYSIRVIRR